MLEEALAGVASPVKQERLERKVGKGSATIDFVSPITRHTAPSPMTEKPSNESSPPESCGTQSSPKATLATLQPPSTIPQSQTIPDRDEALQLELQKSKDREKALEREKGELLTKIENLTLEKNALDVRLGDLSEQWEKELSKEKEQPLHDEEPEALIMHLVRLSDTKTLRDQFEALTEQHKNSQQECARLKEQLAEREKECKAVTSKLANATEAAMKVSKLEDQLESVLHSLMDAEDKSSQLEEKTKMQSEEISKLHNEREHKISHGEEAKLESTNAQLQKLLDSARQEALLAREELEQFKKQQQVARPYSGTLPGNVTTTFTPTMTMKKAKTISSSVYAKGAQSADRCTQRPIILAPLPSATIAPPGPEEGFFESLLQYAQVTKDCKLRGKDVIPGKVTGGPQQSSQANLKAYLTSLQETAAQEELSGRWIASGGFHTASPSTLLAIANAQFESGNFTEAARIARKSLCSIVEEVRLDYECVIRHARNPRVSTSKARLALKEDVAKVYHVLINAEVWNGTDQRRYEKTHRIAVRVCEELLGEQHPAVAELRCIQISKA